MAASPVSAARQTEPDEQVIRMLVRDSYQHDLRMQIDDSLDRHLAVFLATGWVPTRSLAQAA